MCSQIRFGVYNSKHKHNHKRTYISCCMLTVTNMATVRNIDNMSDKFGKLLMGIMHINGCDL